ncbi:MAG: serine/threonine-protein kinase [Cyanobacteria bacterium J06649_12]
MFNCYQKAQVSFKLKDEIGGEGRNSQTFIAHDYQLDDDIVIKIIKKSKITSLDKYFDESRHLYLSNHPNVVKILYACEDNENIYIAMPFYENKSLNSLIENRHLTTREIIRFTSQIVSGVHNIHSKGLIHFDIKPDNILLSKRKEALVSDFGLAQRIDISGEATPQSDLYIKILPPEVSTSKRFNQTFDIYQIGLTIYRMCNGNSIFNEQFSNYFVPVNDSKIFDRNQFAQDLKKGLFPDKKIFPCHIPKKIRNVVRKCLQPNQACRYQSALDIVNAMAEIDGNLLDWQYTIENGERKWLKDKEGKILSLIVCSSGKSIATKTTTSGRTQRIKKFSKQEISEEEIITFLDSH